MDSQRYIDKQSEKLDKLAKEHFSVTVSDSTQSDSHIVTKWFDYLENPNEMSGELTIEMPEYPGVAFQYTKAQIIASKPFDDSDLTGQTILIDGMPIWNAYFTDLSHDLRQ